MSIPSRLIAGHLHKSHIFSSNCHCLPVVICPLHKKLPNHGRFDEDLITLTPNWTQRSCKGDWLICLLHCQYLFSIQVLGYHPMAGQQHSGYIQKRN